MRNPFFVLLLVLALALLPLAARALSSAFTYQGRLAQGGAAPTGSFDFQFTLWDADVDGTAGAPLERAGVAVANGLFTVPLDFGLAPFLGGDRWLSIAVRAAGGGSYTPLTPRQPLRATPYALFARMVHWDGILGRPDGFGVYTAGPGLTLDGQEFRITTGGVTADLLASDALSLRKVSGGAMYSTGAEVQVAPPPYLAESAFGVQGDATFVSLLGPGPDPDAMLDQQSSGAHGYGAEKDYAQSFTAGRDGWLARIVVHAVATSAATLRVYRGTSHTGTLLSLQPVTLASGESTLDLAYPVPVADGQPYTFRLSGTGSFALGYINPGAYDGGELTLGDTVIPGADLWFDTWVQDIAPGLNFVTALATRQGAVGIGTAAPAAGTRLDVAGTAKMTGFQLGSTATAGQVLTADAAGVGTWASLPASFPPSGAAGGDLTGTYPNPAVGAGKIDATKLADNAVTAAKILDGTIAAADLADGAVTAAKLASDAASLAKVTNNGLRMNGTNVGIGTSSAGFPLGFAAALGDKIALWGDTGPHYGLGVQSGLLQVYADNSNSSVAFGYGTSASFTEVMRVKGSGNVGIGTTTPTARLDVAGTVKMTGFQLGSSATAGQVLTASTSGAGTWQALPAAPTSLPPSGPAGGSLTGTYPNPTIAAGAIGSAMLGDSQVTNSKLAADSVTTSKVADSTVTASKLSADADSLAKVSGGVLTSNSTQIGVNTATPAAGVLLDVNGKLKATGFQLGSSATAGQVLTADASGNGSWQPLVAYTAGNGLSLSGTQFSVSFGGAGTATTAARSDHTQAWSTLTSMPAGFADGIDNDTTYAAGNGLTLTGTSFAANFGGAGSATTVARSDHTQAWSTLTGVPAGLADGDNDTTYTAGNGLTLTGTSFAANFGGAGTATTVSRSDHTQAWSTLTSVPAGFADGIDSDTTYTAGNGLTLTGTSFAANFGGTGSATTVSRSDHNHDAGYWKLGGNALSATGVLGSTNNYGLSFQVNGVDALRLLPTASTPNVILGSADNAVGGATYGASIGGGSGNTVSGNNSTIGNGIANQVAGSYSGVSSGYSNNAGGDYGVIAGGYGNTISSSVSYGAIGGGNANQVTGNYGAVPGGYSCSAAGNSLAAGYRAKATSPGAFVWADTQPADLTAFAGNSFSVRAGQGIWLAKDTTTPSMPTGRFINTSTGGYLSTTGTWTNASDRNLKTAFASIDSGALLKKLATLPITEWSYKVGGGERHVGPMAQDFYAAFGLGLDNVSISTVDGIGVALAAAQALQAKVARLEAANAALQAKAAEVDQLRAELAEVKALVKALAEKR